MKTQVSLISLLAVVGASFGFAPSVLAQMNTKQNEEIIQIREELVSQASIAEIVAEVDEFSVLKTALEAADLVDPLMADGEFTVIAPINEAFMALPDGVLEALLLSENKDLLTEILTYHVIAGAVEYDDFETGTIETLGGEELIVRKAADGEIFINGIGIVANNLPATNGVIHIIQDGVLVTEEVATALEARLAAGGGMMEAETVIERTEVRETVVEEEATVVEEETMVEQAETAQPVRGLW